MYIISCSIPHPLIKLNINRFYEEYAFSLNVHRYIDLWVVKQQCCKCRVHNWGVWSLFRWFVKLTNNISGPPTRFSKWGAGQNTTFLWCYNFSFETFRYLEKQFLTLFYLWLLKVYTKSCFSKLTAMSGWLNSRLLTVDHGWTAR